MKKWTVFVGLVLLAAMLSQGAMAQRMTPAQNARQSSKAARKQQKMLKKAAKRQRKAMKKAAKAQRKATIKANRNLQRRRSG